MKNKLLPIIIVAVACALHARTAAATFDATWIGNGDGRWNDPSNWDIGVVPNNSGTDVYNVTIYGPPVTITVESRITIRNFTFNSGGVISNNVSVTVEGSFFWPSGTFTGTGSIIAEGPASMGAVPPFRMMLDRQRLYINGDAELRAPLTLSNAPEPLNQIEIASSASFLLQEAAGLELLAGSSQPTLENNGTLRIKANAVSMLCQMNIANHNLMEIEDRSFNLDGRFDQFSGMLRLLGATLPDYPTNAPVNAFSFHGGSLEGKGHVGTAWFYGSSTPPLVRGQFTFNTLSFEDTAPELAPTMVVALGGRNPGEFSHYEVFDSLILAGKLSVHFTNGFHTVVRPSDAFEFLTPSPTCNVFTASAPAPVPFMNAAYGTRMNTEDLLGAFTLDRATAGTERLTLKDFGLVPFDLEFSTDWNNPLPGMGTGIFPIPSTRFLLSPSATLANPAGHPWDGGSLTLQITGGFDPAFDSLNIQSIPNSSPGNIWVDGPTVRYGGVPIGTDAWVTGPGAPMLTVNFNANASDSGIEALLRRLTYSPNYIWPNFFDNITNRAPSRQMRLTLVNGVAVSTNIDFQVDFPHLVNLAALPQSEDSSFGRLFIYGALSNGEVVQIPNIFIRSDAELGLGGGLERRGPSWFAFHPFDGVVHFSAFDSYTNGAPFHLSVQFLMGNDAAPCTVHYVTTLFTSSSASLRSASSAATSDISLGGFYALESLMNKSAEGRRLAQLYWQHTAEVTEMIRTNLTLREQVRTTILDFQPAVLALLSGKGDEQTISAQMIDRLNKVWTNIITRASPALQSAMQLERARFRDFQDFSGRNFNEWAENLQFDVPKEPFFATRDMRLSNNGALVELGYNDLPGWSLSLWRAPNVTGPWQNVTNALRETLRFGMSHFIDTNALVGPAAFYQLRAEPLP